MKSLRALSTTVGKKVLMGLSGLLLIGFLAMHLTANLLLFLPDGGRAFNLYSHRLHGLGALLTIARIGLAALFIIHIITGIRVYLQNRAARKSRYAVLQTKGGPSKMTAASRWMIVTGLVLMVFVPLHVSMFSMGPYYPTVVDGEQVRDLYTLVVQRFNEPVTAFMYSAVMLFLCFHLMHGFWSALQSIGAMRPRLIPVLYSTGVVIGVLLAGGFFILPLYVYFAVPVPGAV